MRHRIFALPAQSFLLLLALLLLLAAPTHARADADDDISPDDDAYEETARVARVSLIGGDVSLRRAGAEKWERAALNVPLVEGDRLATGPGSRLEIQIDARNFVRVGEYATIDIVTLRAEGVALSLPEGTATVRLARFDRGREYFEIDAPGTTLAAQEKGLYRLDVERDGRVRVAVREGGRARLYSQTSGFTLRDGRTAMMTARSDNDEPDWEFADLRPFDNWDTWVDERERYLLARLRYDNRERYYDESVWGAEELDLYGDWVSTRDYGHVWRPHASAVNNYNDWAPYRYGHWRWVSPYGWTWVPDEPWGWAPYHYGRWVYVEDRWCWAPRGYAGYHPHRPWWRPALVVFVSLGSSYGDNVCWYPLPYRHRDPHSNFWRRAVRGKLTPRHDRELGALKRLPPFYQRAVTVLPSKEFVAGKRAKRPADEELARRAVTTDPVLGRLPLRPQDGDPNSPENLRERLSAGKRAALASRGSEIAAGGPARTPVERPTGAASRKPGVALDEDLRRERIFNNRVPVVTKGLPKGAPEGGDRRAVDGDRRAGEGERRTDGGDRRFEDTRPTGAVSRPSRPVRLPDTGPDKSDTGDRRADAPDSGSGRKRDAVTGERPERRVRPFEPGDSDGGARKSAPDFRRESPPPDPGDDAPARKSKPAPPERERPVFKPSPVERREPPPERHESAPERRESPRYERPEPIREERPSPPPREERHEPPPREERPSPPPQREERPAPPPQREERRDPPPSKSETKGEDRPAGKRPKDND